MDTSEDHRLGLGVREVPGGRTGTLLGSGALLNAGCGRCSNVRISKIEWCAALHGFSVYFTLKRSVKRGTELLLSHKVRGARCKCRRSLHHGPALAGPRSWQALMPSPSPAASAPRARSAPQAQPVTRKCTPQEQTLS